MSSESTLSSRHGVQASLGNEEAGPIRSAPNIEYGQASRLMFVPSEENIAARFDEIADSFYRERRAIENDALDVVGYPALKIALNSAVSGEVCGDLCCGTGGFIDQLLHMDPKKIVGIDISAKMIELASEEFRTEISEGKVQLIHSSVTELDKVLSENELDIATCIYGLDYMDVTKALEQVSYVLKPGGRLIALVPHPERNQAYWEAGGNRGKFPDGAWIVENWLGANSKGVMKQYFSIPSWYDFIRKSPFELDYMEEPTPGRNASQYAPHVYELFQETSHRMMIFDLVNRK